MVFSWLENFENSSEESDGTTDEPPSEGADPKIAVGYEIQLRVNE